MQKTPASARTEIREFLIIATPLAAAYLAEYAMFVTTKMVVGKLGYEELAAVGIAGDLSFEILFILMALLSVVGVLAAQAHGAGRHAELGLSIRQGLVVATLIGVPATLFIWNLDLVLAITGQEAIVTELAKPFLHGLAFMALPILWFSVFRYFSAAMSKTIVVMLITFAAVPVNYLITLLFVHGGLGIPALGLFGAGLAIAVVTWLMFFALAIHIFLVSDYRGYGIFSRNWRVDGDTCREIFRLGIPVAALTLLEAGLFIATSILSGVIGAVTLAAYQVVISWAGIPFMIAFGLSEATMVRVAFAAGRGSRIAVRRAGFLGMGIIAGLTLLLVLVPLLLADPIISIFIDTDDPGFAEVSSLAAQLLVIAAIFQVFDGLQASAARALRGLKDNIVPLWLAGFGYWVLGIGGGSVLAFYFELGGSGLWWGLAAGLFVTSTLLLWRFHRITGRLFQVGAPR